MLSTICIGTRPFRQPPRKVSAIWSLMLAGFFHFNTQCVLQTLEATGRLHYFSVLHKVRAHASYMDVICQCLLNAHSNMNSEDIRTRIRNRFSYLTNEHNFSEDTNISTDDVYSEVRFVKNNWTISIKTISHGTNISLMLISPEQEFGFLSHYLKDSRITVSLDDCTDQLDKNVKRTAELLRTQGSELLEANSEHLMNLLNFLTKEQQKAIKKLM